MANKQRTYARNRAFSRKGREKIFESDAQYILKLVLCIILGSFWIKFGSPIEIGGLTLRALPVGLIVGLLLVRKFEKYQSNRKIWYAVLIAVTIISLFSASGIVI